MEAVALSCLQCYTEAMLLCAALLPIVLPLCLLMVFRMSVRRSMFISLFATLLAALFLWRVSPSIIVASGLQGAHRAVTIIWILIGAITLLNAVRATGALEVIRKGFEHISNDMRVQVVVIGFAFLSLLEGVSGFGTPAVVVAPLLVALGFRSIVAVCVALVSDTIACTFGAVGTPLLVGLENTAKYSSQFVNEVARQVTLFDMVIATSMPLLLVYILVVWFGDGPAKKRWVDWWMTAPWALMVGLSYSTTAFIVVRVIGVEFAAIIAGSVALMVAVVTARRGVLLSRVMRWRSVHAYHYNKVVSRVQKLSLWRAWLPYMLIVAVLLISRAIPAVKDVLHTIDFGWYSILGFSHINSLWPILYSPGTLLLLIAAVAVWVQGGTARQYKLACKQSLRSAVVAAVVLIPVLMMVQIFTNSGGNNAGLVSMPVYLGTYFASIAGGGWILIAPVFGAVGAFIAGSATVSNLTLAGVQESIAVSAELPVTLVIALQVMGAVAGNAIAVHNVVSVATVTGLSGHEGRIIRRTIPVVIIYIAVVATLGFIGWIIL